MDTCFFQWLPPWRHPFKGTFLKMILLFQRWDSSPAKVPTNYHVILPGHRVCTRNLHFFIWKVVLYSISISFHSTPFPLHFCGSCWTKITSVSWKSKGAPKCHPPQGPTNGLWWLIIPWRAVFCFRFHVNFPGSESVFLYREFIKFITVLGQN